MDRDPELFELSPDDGGILLDVEEFCFDCGSDNGEVGLVSSGVLVVVICKHLLLSLGSVLERPRLFVGEFIKVKVQDLSELIDRSDGAGEQLVENLDLRRNLVCGH